jgi:hypothetical protein
MRIQPKPFEAKTTIQTRELSAPERLKRFAIGFFAGLTLIGFCYVPVCRHIYEAWSGKERLNAQNSSVVSTSEKRIPTPRLKNRTVSVQKEPQIASVSNAPNSSKKTAWLSLAVTCAVLGFAYVYRNELSDTLNHVCCAAKNYFQGAPIHLAKA